MVENNNIPNSLEQEMAQKAGELESQHAMRERQVVSLTLRHIVDNIVSKETEILGLMTGKGIPRKAIINIVQEEVRRCADGIIWVTNYLERLRSDQKVNVYTGTHWQPIANQQWKDFVGHCAEKCGVPDSMRMDTSLMKQMYEDVAFIFSKYRIQNTIDNAVWLNVPNGTLVIENDGSVTMRSHDKDDLFFYCLHYDYNKQATCEQWLRFLDRVLPDKNAQQLLAEFICYILMRSHRFEKMLWLYGSGQNGKSVTLSIISGLLGSENVSNVSLDGLTNDQKMRAVIEHKLVNISYETGRDINANVMKQLTSGEPISTERKYENVREITDYGKLIISTNRLPKSENTAAFFRRIIILPFKAVISEEEKDVHLTDKLMNELPGILNWVLAALPGLLERQAFTSCDISEQAMEDYKMESNNVYLFKSECLEDAETLTCGQDIYNAYVSYCNELHQKALGRNYFYNNLNELTNSLEKKDKRTYFKLKLIE